MQDVPPPVAVGPPSPSAAPPVFVARAAQDPRERGSGGPRLARSRSRHRRWGVRRPVRSLRIGQVRAAEPRRPGRAHRRSCRPARPDADRATESMLTACRHDHVGFVFRSQILIPSLTVRENVEPVAEIARDPMRPEEVIERVGRAGGLVAEQRLLRWHRRDQGQPAPPDARGPGLVSVLDRKVIRDLGTMCGHRLTIAPLIGAGIAMLVMSVGAHLPLLATPRARAGRPDCQPASNIQPPSASDSLPHVWLC
jgi:hypothetical protein